MDRVKIADMFQRLCDLSTERFPEWTLRKFHRGMLAVEVPPDDISEAIAHFASVGAIYGVPLAILAVDVSTITDDDLQKLGEFNRSNEFDNDIVHINTLQSGCRSQMFIHEIINRGGFVLLLTTPPVVEGSTIFNCYCASLKEVIDKKLLPMPGEVIMGEEVSPVPA